MVPQLDESNEYSQQIFLLSTGENYTIVITKYSLINPRMHPGSLDMALTVLIDSTVSGPGCSKLMLLLVKVSLKL